MTLLRTLLWKIANRFGGPRLRTWSQNDQYRNGRWNRQGDGRRPTVVDLVEKLADGGRVVEHACGQGHLAAQVDPECYTSYTGYDLSVVAIEAARQRSASDRCSFEVQDMLSWTGDSDLSLIVAEECLNYLRPGQLREFLGRCRASLAPGGAVLATFHDGRRYPDAVAECRAQFPAHEGISEGTSLYLVLRP